MRRVKIRAIQERQKTKHVLAKELNKVSPEKKKKLPKPLKLRDGFIPTTDDIEAAIAEGQR